MTPVSILVLGFLLGLKHATEADHLAAVATLATRSGSLGQAVQQGAAWGAGHTLTLMAFGGVVILLGAAIPEHAAQFLELAVGIMLVGLGADVLRRLRRQHIHFHLHSHGDGLRHVHAHSHLGDTAPHALSPHAHVHPDLPVVRLQNGLPWRALMVGMMHGLAGSAALVLLSIGATGSPAAALLYILLFGIGSIVGMATLSIIIAVPLRLSAAYVDKAHSALSALVGVGSVGLGVFIVYHIGFAQGLLR